jgi:ATP synthase protein I
MPDDKRRQYQQLLEASSLGLMFPLAIGLGYGMGYGLDHLFHTKPWLTWIFTAFGVVAAFINLFRTAAGSDGGTPPTSGG